MKKFVNLFLVALVLLMSIPWSVEAARPSDPPIQDNQWQFLGGLHARFNSGVAEIQAGDMLFTAIPVIDGGSFSIGYLTDNGKGLERAGNRVKYKRSGQGPDIGFTVSSNMVTDRRTAKCSVQG